jgi:hypothetical protein
MRGVLVMTLLALAATAPLQAQERANENLRLDRETIGRVGASGEAAHYRFTPRGPGIITLMGTSVIDIAIVVLDDEGQVVPSGYIDRDYLDDMGKEWGVVVIGARGEYTIEVRGVDDDEGGGEFSLTATFLADPMFARAPDADGKPSGARAIAVGFGHDDSVAPNMGDKIDWYTFTVDEDGTYFIATRAEASLKNDLMIQAFVGDALLDSPTIASDQDLRDNVANESVSVEVKAGTTVRFRVLSLSDKGDPMAYRASVGKMP